MRIKDSWLEKLIRGYYRREMKGIAMLPPPLRPSAAAHGQRRF